MEGYLVSAFTLQHDGSFILFMNDGRIAKWRSIVETIVEGIPEIEGSRFNDVTADPHGRIFCGTMPAKGGRSYLYVFDTDCTLNLISDDFGQCNGMAFSPDEKTFYITDTKRQCIYAFDYDDGRITSRREFARAPAEEKPDGLDCDADGNLWSARWGNGEIVSLAKTGQEQRRISLPVKSVSGITFGGENLNALYVASATEDDEMNPLAGALFKIDIDVAGKPRFHSRIQL